LQASFHGVFYTKGGTINAANCTIDNMSRCLSVGKCNLDPENLSPVCGSTLHVRRVCMPVHMLSAVASRGMMCKAVAHM
jgi:hypothetical protein